MYKSPPNIAFHHISFGFPSPNFLKRNQTPPLQGERSSTTRHLHATATSEAALAAAVLTVSAAAEGRAASLAAAAELVLLAVAALGPAGDLLVGGRDDLGGKGQVGAKVLDALVGEVAVVVLPVEGDADEAAGFQGLHEHHDLEVGGSLDVGVGGRDGVLLDDEDALLEEVGEGRDAVGLGDEHL